MMAAAIFSVMLLPGCSSGGSQKPKPAAWALQISKPTAASIAVDIIGVNRFSKPAWEGYDLNQYWDPNDRRRKEQLHKETLNLKQGETYTLDANHAKWKIWLDEEKATELLILADLPGTFSGGPGDPRRLFLPLDRKYWDIKDTEGRVMIQVQETQIRVLTAPRR